MTDVASPHAAGAASGDPFPGPSIASYFAAFAPAPEWHDLVAWPPDVFALTNLVLDHSEAYRFVVAPPPGCRWPPLRGWSERSRAAAERWRAGDLAGLVSRSWRVVTRLRDVPLADVRSGAAWELCEALLTLHAIADEACATVASSGRHAPPSSFDGRAWGMLQAEGSLSRLSPTRVRIVPKTNFSARGITIRSLSRYLALCYESVDVRWRTVGPERTPDRGLEVVLFPWPLMVRSRDFRPARETPLENMDLERFGFFEFAPEQSLHCDVVGRALDAALGLAGCVDAVIFPEDAVDAGELEELERTLDERGVGFLVAGVREPATASHFGRNYLHFGIRTEAGWDRLEQDKHHRWCLDEGQIRQYHLTRTLDPRKLWWEAIDIRERTLHIVDVGGGVTTAPLVCEDLARLDEVADLVRRIGPGLVVAVLLDGPQLPSRWACRYASILADDPGAAILTLTSLGMAALSRPPGTARSRVVAHWNGAAQGTRAIELAPRASAILLSTEIARGTSWTADGRRHADVPALTLASVRQLHAGRKRVSGARPHAQAARDFGTDA